jgi:hypothetical protein
MIWIVPSEIGPPHGALATRSRDCRRSIYNLWRQVRHSALGASAEVGALRGSPRLNGERETLRSRVGKVLSPKMNRDKNSPKCSMATHELTRVPQLLRDERTF